MKKSVLKLVVIFFPVCVLAQSRTINSNAGNPSNWDNTARWTGGNIGDLITEDVILNNGVNAVVRSTFSYTIGNITTSGNDSKFEVEANGSLTLGANGTSKSLSMTGTNPKIKVTGTLTIWGNASFTNKVDWDISGTVIIKGNLQMPSGTSMQVRTGGSLTVEGNFSGGNNTDVTIASGGAVRIYHDVSATSGNLNNSGIFEFGGTCTPASGGNFCPHATSNSALPVTLLSFTAQQIHHEGVELVWTTAAEKNFDKFVIQRLDRGEDFLSLGEQKGKSHNGEAIFNGYSFVDTTPLVGNNYYRLKSLDLNGNFEYSPVIHLVFNGARKVWLYPSPANESMIHVVSNFPAEKNKVQIFNNLGSKVQEHAIAENAYHLQFANELKPGVYLMRYISDNHQQIVRFTVR